jgi:hypothetical protein
MMQETSADIPAEKIPRGYLSGQGLVTLLALVGAKRIDVEALRERTKLKSVAFGDLLSWLQQEYLVDVVARQAGDRLEEKVELTEWGRQVLFSTLERTCELPE